MMGFSDVLRRAREVSFFPPVAFSALPPREVDPFVPAPVPAQSMGSSVPSESVLNLRSFLLGRSGRPDIMI